MSQRSIRHAQRNSSCQEPACKPSRLIIRYSPKLVVLCFSLLGLNLLEQYYGERLFPLASANNAVVKTDNDLSVLLEAEFSSRLLLSKEPKQILIAQNAADTAVDAAPESDQVEVESTSDATADSEDDYLVPKTVYLGVDSVASPVVVPEIATEPESTVSNTVEVDEQSTIASQDQDASQPIVEAEAAESTTQSESAQVLAPVDSPDLTINSESASVEQDNAPAAETESAAVSIQTQVSSNESNAVDESTQATQSAETNAEEMVRAPEIQQTKSESINSVSKRITLFKSIDVTSELDVPAGLPEDLNENQDFRETTSTDNSNASQEEQPPASTQADSSEAESQVAKIENPTEEIQEQGQNQDNSDENIADEADDTDSAQDIKKPAVVVNINNGTQIDARNEWGWTKLMSAAIEGNQQMVDELLARGANADIAGEDGRSPLMAASWNKHHQIVESLINAGADVNLINRDGWTALSFAAWNGDLEIVRSLLRFAANKYIKTADGFTPLQLAEQKGHLEIVALLK